MIVINGHERHLGLIPSTEEKKKLFTPFRDVVPVLPRDKWQCLDLKPRVRRILDQDGQGACVGFSAATAMAASRDDGIELSGGCIYGQINGGRDDGAMIADALTALQQTGVCTAATIGQLDWKAARNSSAWKEEAKSFKILEGYICKTFDELATGLSLGFIGIFGVEVTDRFEPGADGWIPEYAKKWPNHAVCCCNLVQKGSKWGILMPNTWGTSWGLSGWCIVPESNVCTDEMWLIRTTTLPEKP